MKKLSILLLFITIITSCKKDIPEPPTEADSNTSAYASHSAYQITFFSNNFAGAPISVSIDGNTAGVTYAYNYDPGCNATGCANFTLPFGTYTYYYVSNSGNTVSGTILTGASQCITILVN